MACILFQFHVSMTAHAYCSLTLVALPQHIAESLWLSAPEAISFLRLSLRTRTLHLQRNLRRAGPVSLRLTAMCGAEGATAHSLLKLLTINNLLLQFER